MLDKEINIVYFFKISFLTPSIEKICNYFFLVTGKITNS